MPESLECVSCKRKAVFLRRYSGELLCSSCFKKSIIEKTRKTISRYNLFGYKDRVAIAVSGGKDSLSLLHVLKRICAGHGSQLYVITIDEGVEGYRDDAINIVRRISAKLEVPLLVLSFKELYGTTIDDALKSENRRVTSCTACGVLRRRAMDVAAQRVGANVLATAHNLDDFLQTFHMNILNGDIRRLRWLNPLLRSSGFGIRRVKPFMEIYETEIAFYAHLQKLPFQNYVCPYMNESIRSEIRFLLNDLERIHPGLKYSSFRAAMEIAQKLTAEQTTKYLKCEKCGYPSSNRECSVCKTLLALKVNSQI